MQGIAHLFTTLILSIPLAAIGLFDFTGDLTQNPGFLFGAKSVETISLLITIGLARKFLDKRSFVSLGFDKKRAGLELAAGVGIALALFGIIFVAFTLLGWVKIESYVWETISFFQAFMLVALMVGNFILVGFGEEIWVRGYIFQNLEEGMNTAWAILVSSGIFGLLHIFNPDATLVSTTGIFLAGLLFAYAYLRTRQLWLPIGLHVGWNFFENTVFGFPVSGLDTPGMITLTTTGPDLFTGGAFGPEAGLILLPVLAIGFLMIKFLPLREN